ncbi:cell volume regulation protein A [Motilibacter peucedani]|uniref:Cell volume regulation protein A n=1 Tax=Motilibacter peucedani TaxID=598650 RepID=A0A420XKN3_9ACTN|nr:cation:proton antiporter [Motilibacter peucedani]RKS68465.1 cell volume regulation protein A [Motilibacter peucedani]
MSETEHYALVVLLAALAGLAAVLSNRLTERLRVPAPLLVLASAAVAVAVVPDLHAPSGLTVEHVVTLALVVVLFDGGMHIGWDRFRAAAAPIVAVGVAGTFLTAAAGGLLLHVAFGLDWYPALLVATAVAPTDPAVVFSVLGRRQIAGRSSTVLEGESGANDPVGIALLASLLSAGGVSAGAFGHVAWEFCLQMGVGAVVGVVGGRLLLVFVRRVPLPSEALYPLRTTACAFVLYGVGTLAHGSGFLAVFVAGILVGDAGAPYKREVERFSSALGSLGEIVAFVLLGLTIDLDTLRDPDVLWPGLVLAVVLALVIRPVLAGLCLLPARLRPPELAFVLFSGLKGAVPILLGVLVLEAHVPQAERLFGIVVVVVVFSVLVQGSLVPVVAELLRLPVRTVEPEPWSIGVRLRDEPDGVHRLHVEPGSRADGVSVERLQDQLGGLWVSIVVRESQLVAVRAGTRLQAGDDVVVLADPELHDRLAAEFAVP